MLGFRCIQRKKFCHLFCRPAQRTDSRLSQTTRRIFTEKRKVDTPNQLRELGDYFKCPETSNILVEGLKKKLPISKRNPGGLQSWKILWWKGENNGLLCFDSKDSPL